MGSPATSSPATSSPATIRLYDLAAADPDRRFSPYCWRTRLALAHKGLPVETVPWRFTEKEAISSSGSLLVPVIVDGDRWIADSWTIANYLEDTFPDRPSLFGAAASRQLTRFYSCFADTLVSAIFPFIVLDIHRQVHEKDREYFRQSREKRVGMTLEAFTVAQADRIDAFRKSLAPLRQTFKTQPFLGGEQPLYADYAMFGPFQWARTISPFVLLEMGDPVRIWRDRLLDAFDGLARTAPAYDS
jgi:glutathione S-transferase